ncbi:telomere binding protein [Malassezia equina]|uniref:Telomere binding protein n=1 Tax=Malassezia equina TaxID=1381935 RepID=A0AAF0J0M9_9BASI|nr:telomere binding protein [Malassezia equina]
MSDDAWPSCLSTAATWEQVLEALLPPLRLVDYVPAAYAATTREAPGPPGSVPGWWGTCQHTLLTTLCVTWAEALQRHNLYEQVLRGYFVPDGPASLAKARVWTHTLATCTALLTMRAEYHRATLDALTLILTHLDATRLLCYTLQACDAESHAARRDLQWMEAAAQMSALPTRVANVYGPRPASHALLDTYVAWPASLAPCIAQRMSLATAERLAVLLTRLARAGHITPAFWRAAAPHIHDKAAWARVWDACEDRVHETMLHSLLALWQARIEGTSFARLVAQDERAPGLEGRAFLTREAMSYAYSAYRMLATIASEAEAPRWSWVRLSGTSTVVYAPLLCMAIAAWAMDAEPKDSLEALLRIWSDPRRLARASVAQAEESTTLLLMAVRCLRDAPEALRAHATSPCLLRGVAAHMEHNDPTIRRLGMLMAEVWSAASNAERPLHFPADVWDGRGDGRETCRVLRAWFDQAGPLWPSMDVVAWPEAPVAPSAPPERTVVPRASAPVSISLPRRVPARRPLVVDLSKETMADITPMESDDDSSEEEREDANDTSVLLDTALRKKPRVPVYIYELVPLLRERAYAANKLALKHAEPLIRRKTGWGMEVAEHAVDVAIALAALQDNYDLRAFEERRTRALTALCVAAPGIVVDCLCEQVFSPHYALAQRLAMLRAIAEAAQEMAGLTPFDPGVASRQLIEAATARACQQGEAQLVQHGADKARWQAVRLDATPAQKAAPSWSVKPTVPFTAAARAFIFPLLRRCEAAQQHASRTYAGSDATTAPHILAAVLHTLCVLCQAGRHAPFFATRIMPDVLEMAERQSRHTDASVASAAFALVLVLLDAAKEAQRLIVQAQAPCLVRVQSVAESYVAARPGGALERSAAAVVLRISEMQAQVRQALLGL